ncbi:hypothetical protein HPP92_019132 [Vanilla planifolia]|uniref:Uncharacterized protein n=1 Tax=Vanilla planifolia TaxID=51239 RepID=A0A835Q589_VANPL|nr:hypothetical protein HPP92_019132 [Vanilla planifolia]
MICGHVTEVTNSCDVQRSRDRQSAPELISIGSKALLEVASVEDGEEVEQVRASPSVQSRSPIRAPLGIGRNDRGHSYRDSHSSFASVQRSAKFEVPEYCQNSYVLPDLVSLQKRLERKLETQGLSLSVDYVNLLGNALDAQLKRIIKPCLELAKSRCDLSRKSGNFGHGMNGSWNEEDMQKSSFCHAASLTDFKVAMQSNPYLLGVDWPVQLEKICTYVSME